MFYYEGEKIDESKIFDIVNEKYTPEHYEELLNSIRPALQTDKGPILYGTALRRDHPADFGEGLADERKSIAKTIIWDKEPTDTKGIGIRYIIEDSEDEPMISVLFFKPGMERPELVRMHPDAMGTYLKMHNRHMSAMEYVPVRVNGIEVDIWHDSEFRYHAEFMSAMHGDKLFIRGGFLVAGHEGEQTISVPFEVVNKLTESMDYVQIEDDDTHGWVVRF